MDAGHIGLGVAAAIGVAGIVWLLVEKGRLTARAQVAESEARSAQERRDAAEKALAELKGAIEDWTRRLTTAQAEQARLSEALQREQAAREEDRRRAERAVEEAVEHERRLHAEELRRLESVHAEKLAAVQEARKEIEARLAGFEQKMKESFGALAGEALHRSSESFLKLAEKTLAEKSREAAGQLEERKAAIEALVKPIAESLRKTDSTLAAMEKEWASSRATLAEQIRGVMESGEALRAETAKLGRAFSRPEVRGFYGEKLKLERIAELSGLQRYCDFDTQVGLEDGRRPDMVVRLPNERVVVVDAKCPLEPYLQAMSAGTEAERAQHLRRFADRVAQHVKDLSGKGYWSGFDGAADFVVLFLPGDQLYDAALSESPGLLSEAAERRVLIATPATLIGMLRVIATAWAEHRLAREADELRELGKKLHQHMATALEHIARVGRGLASSVGAYDDFIRSYMRFAEPTLRKFEEAGVKSSKTLPEVKPVGAKVPELPMGGGGGVGGVGGGGGPAQAS